MNTGRSILVYDCEIAKAILGRGEAKLEGIEYCGGWRDFAGMGISCIGAYDYLDDRYRVFMKDNFNEFVDLATTRQTLVSFNGLAFDNPLIEANVPGLKFASGPGDFDILVEMWKAVGLTPSFNYPSHTGFGLDAAAAVNLGARKTGNGALAPVWWQRGEIGKVIDYCLQDIKLTKGLMDQILLIGGLRDPRNSRQFLEISVPG